MATCGRLSGIRSYFRSKMHNSRLLSPVRDWDGLSAVSRLQVRPTLGVRLIQGFVRHEIMRNSFNYFLLVTFRLQFRKDSYKCKSA